MVYYYYRWLMHIWKLWIRKIDGINNIPKDKPFIVALNHSSYYDIGIAHSILVPLLNKRVHAFVSSYFWKYKIIIHSFLNPLGGIPVYVQNEKNSRQKNKKSFQKAQFYIKKGDIVVIFPEGTRSPDGSLVKPYTGIAKLALAAKVPVIPMGIIGSNKVWPREKIFPRFKRCQVKIGKPIYFSKYYNKTLSKNDFEKITRAIMKEIAKLIGQKYNY